MFDIDYNSGISFFKLFKAAKSSKKELIPKLSDQLSAISHQPLGFEKPRYYDSLK